MHVVVPPPVVPAPAGPADRATASRGRFLWGVVMRFRQGDPGAVPCSRRCSSAGPIRGGVPQRGVSSESNTEARMQQGAGAIQRAPSPRHATGSRTSRTARRMPAAQRFVAHDVNGRPRASRREPPPQPAAQRFVTHHRGRRAACPRLDGSSLAPSPRLSAMTPGARRRRRSGPRRGGPRSRRRPWRPGPRSRTPASARR